MPIETLDDILEELADKIGSYGEQRNEWTIITKRRIQHAVLVEYSFRKPDDLVLHRETPIADAFAKERTPPIRIDNPPPPLVTKWEVDHRHW